MKSLRQLIGILSLGALAAALTASDGKKETDVPKLIKQLQSTVPAIRANAARDLGDLGAIAATAVKESIPTLLDLAKKDKDAGVRKAAVAALGKVDADPKDAVPVLVGALKDKANDVRIAAIESLGQIGAPAKEATPQLRELQKDKEKKDLSRAAGMALKRINAKN